jgi:hypothetical protein
MDAMRKPGWWWAGALVVLWGCTDPAAPPAAHQDSQPPADQAEPPQVVSNDDVAAGDDVSRNILSWVDRLGKVEPRDNRQRFTPTTNPAPTTQVSDVQLEPDLPAAATAESVSGPAGPLLSATTQPRPTEPPSLAGVVARAAPDAPRLSADTAAPQVNAPAYARNAPTSLRAFLEQSLPAEESSFRAQLDRRMLWVMAGDYERARAPLSLVTAEQQELATRFVEAWIAVRDWHAGDPSRAAGAAARELDELREALQRLSDLSVPTVKICSAVRSFGQYDELEPARFPAASPVEFVLYCEVRDYVSELRDDMYTSTFDLTTAILNRVGDTVLEIKDTNIVDRCRNRRHDCFIPRLVRLPATLSPGQYVAKVTLVDKLGQKVAEGRATFQLAAPQ